MDILLINPGSEDDILQRVMREIPFLDSPAFFAPHALAAVAAVTPPGHRVVIHDENLHGPVEALLDREPFHVVGITLSTNQQRRATSILEHCRERKLAAHRVIGGIGAGTMPAGLKTLADTIFWGEAEETWPAFLRDLAAGRPLRFYQRMAKPDMALTPAPRWELIAPDIRRYGAVSVQTSRGCPFDCAFCDVIYTYGRAVRQKPIDRVLDEVRTLQRLGAKMVMFADDNFAADRPYVKELLRRLGPLNNSFPLPLSFITQLDITIARDDELLELLADAHFVEVQIGIESTSPEALAEMDKRQNLSVDILEAVRAIQSYGIVVMAHMIVGADADDPAAFERTARFLREGAITHHQCHPLIAPPGTRLWYDLKRQGRLVAFTDEMRDRLDITTNILPLKMSRGELMEGLAALGERVHRPDAHLERALAFMRGIRRLPRVKDPGAVGLWKNRRLIVGIFSYFLFRAGAEQRRTFLALVGAVRRQEPRLMPTMMYVQTGYLMDAKRAGHSAAIAREQVTWEKANPGAVATLSTATPVWPGVRREMPAIARAAWEGVAPLVTGREERYRAIVAALVDYNDRFGEQLDEFDEPQADHLRRSCERVLGTSPGAAPSSGATGRAVDAPPPGFPREMLDALDRALNTAAGGWESGG